MAENLQREVDKIFWAYNTPATTMTCFWTFFERRVFKTISRMQMKAEEIVLRRWFRQEKLQKSKQYSLNQGIRKKYHVQIT